MGGHNKTFVLKTGLGRRRWEGVHFFLAFVTPTRPARFASSLGSPPIVESKLLHFRFSSISKSSGTFSVFFALPRASKCSSSVHAAAPLRSGVCARARV